MIIKRNSLILMRTTNQNSIGMMGVSHDNYEDKREKGFNRIDILNEAGACHKNFIEWYKVKPNQL